MNVVVTGASQGLGFELVKQFCRLNPEIRVLAMARSLAKLNQLKEVCIDNFGVEISIMVIDFSKDDFHLDLLNKMPETFSAVDVLINNSASLINKSFLDNNYEDALLLYKVNTLGPYFLTQGLMPLLMKSEYAHVVNISSMGGFQGSSKFPGLSLYSSSKAALSNLTECLAEELKETVVKVNALALGSINTAMLRNAFPGYTSPNSPEVMAKYVCDFAINSGSIYNGKVLPVSNSTP
jgi:short-subunit dehydrogenase